jgi:hypothetical protein
MRVKQPLEDQPKNDARVKEKYSLYRLMSRFFAGNPTVLPTGFASQNLNKLRDQ